MTLFEKKLKTSERLSFEGGKPFLGQYIIVVCRRPRLQTRNTADEDVCLAHKMAKNFIFAKRSHFAVTQRKGKDYRHFLGQI